MIIDNSVSLQILCGLITLYLNLTFARYIWALAAIAVKEKLESLCREFQRQNKMLKVFSAYLNSESIIIKVFAFLFNCYTILASFT